MDMLDVSLSQVLLIDQTIKDISSDLPRDKLRDLVYSADVTTLYKMV